MEEQNKNVICFCLSKMGHLSFQTNKSKKVESEISRKRRSDAVGLLLCLNVDLPTKYYCNEDYGFVTAVLGLPSIFNS